jgi:hypothetical protein
MTVSKKPVTSQKSQTSQKWRPAVLAAVAVPALTLVACSATGEEGVDEPAGSEVSEAPDFVGERLPDAIVDGAPEGVDVTEPGRELSFGEAGYVVTGGAGAPQYWRVTVQEPEKVAADEITLTGDANADVDTFVCLTYTVELLHADAAPVTDAETTAETTGETRGAEPDEEEFEAAVPALDPVDDKAREANRVLRAGEAECGVDEEDALPSDPADVEPDTTYTRAVLSYVDKDPRRGISPTGMAFTYDLDGAPETTDSTVPTAPTDSTAAPESAEATEETPDDNDVVLWN